MSEGRATRPFRVHQRRPLKLRVGLVHPRESWEGEARVQNIGLGGAGLEMSGCTLNQGDRILLYFTAPTLWDPLEMPAKVAWIRTTSPAAPTAPATSQFGVAFEPADPHRVLALFDLIASFAFDD